MGDKCEHNDQCQRVKEGIVTFVGAVAGDVGLMTVKGMRALQTADVVVYDACLNARLLYFAPEYAERLCVHTAQQVPLLNSAAACGCDDGTAVLDKNDVAADSETINADGVNALMVARTREGKRVVRLMYDNPFTTLDGVRAVRDVRERGVRCEVVPAVPATVVAATYAGIPVGEAAYTMNAPLTAWLDRESQQDTQDVHKPVLFFDTTVATAEELAAVCGQLMADGYRADTPVALICHGTRGEQRVLDGTLATITEQLYAEERLHVCEQERDGSGSPATHVSRQALGEPCVVAFGEPVRVDRRIAWLQEKPLSGHRVLVTRPRGQNRGMVHAIERLGGEPYEFPTIRIVDPADYGPLDQAIRQLGSFKWVIFTSVNGVEHFFRRIRAVPGVDIRQMADARIAAVGPKTAEALAEKGLEVDLLPGEYRAEALLTVLEKNVMKGDRILLPRANIARNVLPDGLRALGCDVTDVDAYRTVTDASRAGDVARLLARRSLSIATFTSSSTVRNFVQALEATGTTWRQWMKGVQVACIGPIAAGTARELGLEVDIVATDYTTEGLLTAIQAAIEQKGE
ncbi:bifunctional uroporphyrinogen-III C-methyltransferase/uroporphyrinogen-III synthase [Numidum massiliense]|uniref:uroporphyrinogen-III synthase n=1 Tax=Numidum massiliense TaxID=1522315 RepID=UPI0006D5317E|nr:uroporphyrinogen-III synthase [Numidum massiliense]